MGSSLRSVRDIDTVQRFSSRASTYTRFRWPYDPRAIATLCAVARLDADSVLADIGSGPGTVAEQLAPWVGRVFAIEPNLEMLKQARANLGAYPACAIVAGRAEATPLKAASVDAITVGRALHWFDPDPTRAEFRRITKPGGWLAILRHVRTDGELEQAVRALQKPEFGWSDDNKQTIEAVGDAFYFREGVSTMHRFPGVRQEDWESFLGRLISHSPAPDSSHPLRPRYEEEARKVFDGFASSALLTVHFETRLILGQLT